ncbi:putative fungal specific transcription protein [Eutypa lata UCREL1]|uniref:Putative fungal specific transcription protein n=1 Tax=Eutypa lata (strain UCR-EL1) TaxID=1287681 RepID=M7TV49_EUTLA|nr:putative fungal specific transcription protein [Eutypa lata UCREL1]
MPHSPPASSAYPDMLDPGPTPPKQETLGKAVDEGSECRSLQVGSLEHRYVGGAHWAAILDGIADLKNHFDRDEHIMSIATGSDHDDLVFMPSSFFGRHESDALSAQLGMYREKIVQCLILGEYTNSGPYALETLYHYVQIEFSMRADADKDIWFLLALGVNQAMRASYHRDPRNFPEISPFQGEMRRRMWASLLQGDILISSQMGMPRMISDWQCDTSEPRNLNDADFDVDVGTVMDLTTALL